MFVTEDVNLVLNYVLTNTKCNCFIDFDILFYNKCMPNYSTLILDMQFIKIHYTNMF